MTVFRPGLRVSFIVGQALPCAPRGPVRSIWTFADLLTCTLMASWTRRLSVRPYGQLLTATFDRQIKHEVRSNHDGRLVPFRFHSRRTRSSLRSYAKKCRGQQAQSMEWPGARPTGALCRVRYRVSKPIPAAPALWPGGKGCVDFGLIFLLLSPFSWCPVTDENGKPSGKNGQV